MPDQPALGRGRAACEPSAAGDVEDAGAVLVLPGPDVLVERVDVPVVSAAFAVEKGGAGGVEVAGRHGAGVGLEPAGVEGVCCAPESVEAGAVCHTDCAICVDVEEGAL